jgi:hypothetical protein
LTAEQDRLCRHVQPDLVDGDEDGDDGDVAAPN